LSTENNRLAEIAAVFSQPKIGYSSELLKWGCANWRRWLAYSSFWQSRL